MEAARIFCRLWRWARVILFSLLVGSCVQRRSVTTAEILRQDSTTETEQSQRQVRLSPYQLDRNFETVTIDFRGDGANESILVDFSARNLDVRWSSAPKPILLARRGSNRNPPEPLFENSRFTEFNLTEAMQETIRIDLEGYWAWETYHYLVLPNSHVWTVFVFNLNLHSQRQADDQILEGLLSFRADSKRPCPRGKVYEGQVNGPVCSKRGTCDDDEGVCRCDESHIGHFCEDELHTGETKIEMNEQAIEASSSVHHRLKADCTEKTGVCQYMLMVATGEDTRAEVMLKEQNQQCEAFNRLSEATIANKVWVDSTCFKISLTPLSPWSTVKEFEHGAEIIATVANLEPTPQVYDLILAPCGGPDQISCPRERSFTGILYAVPMVCIILCCMSLIWVDFRRRTRGPAYLIKRNQIKRMFTAVPYRRPTPELDDDASPAAAECIICLCEFENGELVRQLGCEHMFHSKCIDKWFRAHVTCPSCRQPASRTVPPRKSWWARLMDTLRGNRPQQTDEEAAQTDGDRANTETNDEEDTGAFSQSRQELGEQDQPIPTQPPRR